MRADRLVAILLLMQTRGRVTAAEVADELEVSVATARRDLEALSTAGVPVYPQAGRGGGWSLVGGARTDLSGLTAAEARTLFLVAGPSSAVTPPAQAPPRQVGRAPPATVREGARRGAPARALEPGRWGETAPPRAARRSWPRAPPKRFREGPEGAASAVLFARPVGGNTTPPRPPHLEALQQAVVQGVQVRPGYADRAGAATERTVHPLGLVSKES